MGWTPLPERAIWGELVALLATDTLPLSVPPATGAKPTLKVALCPAAKVIGVVRPLAVKPLPATASCETVTLELPVLVRATVLLLLLPTLTFPKLTLVGLAPSCTLTAAPVPPSGITVGEVGALLTKARLPVALPVAVGAKFTVKVAELPGSTVSGRLRPFKAKPLPETKAWETLRLALPGLLTVMAWVLVVPIVTLPKLTFPGITETCD